MKKFTSFLKRNIQLSVTVFAVLALIVSNTYFVARAQEILPDSVQAEQKESVNAQLSPQEFASMDLNGSTESYPHLNCVQELVRTTEPSDVYVSDAPYSLQFHGTNQTSNFQDVNGDNLPDYVYAFNVVDGGTTLFQTYMGCVYLNNGAGWDKAYQCYAETHTNTSSGEITSAQYYGDCAGTPSGQGEDKE